MGGRPPTSTTLKTSTSSCTRPARALETAAETFDSCSTSRGFGKDVGYKINGVWSFAADRLRLRDARVSRKVLMRSLSVWH